MRVLASSNDVIPETSSVIISSAILPEVGPGKRAQHTRKPIGTAVYRWQMKYQEQQNELRDRLAGYSQRVRAAVAQGLTDLPKLSENLVAALLKELLGFRNIRNLNAAEKANFPGLDLADNEMHVGVQVTATSGLDKIKSTIATVLKHNLHERYPRVVVVVLSEKQSSYSQTALDTVCDGRLVFLANRDILDYRDLLRSAANVSPVSLQLALEAFRAYDSGVARTLDEGQFDPPTITETVSLNLVELYIPRTLYVADLLKPDDGVKGRVNRKSVRAQAETLGKKLPSGFEVNSGQLLTFTSLEGANPFEGLYDPGTITPLSPDEFAAVDEPNQRVLKSLLRLGLQQQVYAHGVRWMYEERLFCFVPEVEGTDVRDVVWKDKRQATRSVYVAMRGSEKYSWVTYRHFAFDVEFLWIDRLWYVLLRPDWYFSVGPPDYRKSPGAETLTSGLKRLENNQAIEQHFRFLCYWLRSIETGDLLASDPSAGRMSFGDGVTFDTHPCLDDSRWLPVKPDETESVEAATGLLLLSP